MPNSTLTRLEEGERTGKWPHGACYFTAEFESRQQFKALIAVLRAAQDIANAKYQAHARSKYEALRSALAALEER